MILVMRVAVVVYRRRDRRWVVRKSSGKVFPTAPELVTSSTLLCSSGVAGCSSVASYEA